MKLLGYIFAALAIVALGATLMGYEHQFLMFAIAGMMAYAILSEEKEKDNETE